MNEPECKGNSCEYHPTTDRKVTRKKRPIELRYAQLWLETEMKEALGER